jgi:RHS repeat-associated protein
VGTSSTANCGWISAYIWKNGVTVLSYSSSFSYNVTLEPEQVDSVITVSLQVINSYGRSHTVNRTITVKRDHQSQYFVKDHLGSPRVVVDGKGAVLSHTDYYPFGMVMPDRAANISLANDRVKFTGYLLEEEGGQDTYHAEARGYDPVIGRFSSKDPHAANYPSFSPFIYAANNPLFFVDPDGRDIQITRDEEKKTVTVAGNFYYSSSQLDPDGSYNSMEALVSNLLSWGDDITTAISELGMEDYAVSVNFAIKEVNTDGMNDSESVVAIRDAANADPIGNSVVHDGAVNRASVIGNKHMVGNMSLAKSDPYVFAGQGNYQGTLKHEIGHLMGLRDNAIPGDLMNNRESYRGNAVVPFMRVMQWNSLNIRGSKTVTVNKNNREPQ